MRTRQEEKEYCFVKTVSEAFSLHGKRDNHVGALIRLSNGQLINRSVKPVNQCVNDLSIDQSVKKLYRQSISLSNNQSANLQSGFFQKSSQSICLTSHLPVKQLVNQSVKQTD